MRVSQMSSGTSPGGQHQFPDGIGCATAHAHLISEDGRMSVRLHRSAAGLSVQRESVQRSGERLVQCAVFKEADRFHSWCDSDPLRFTYPRVSHEVRRYGSEALLRLT